MCLYERAEVSMDMKENVHIWECVRSCACTVSGHTRVRGREGTYVWTVFMSMWINQGTRAITQGNVCMCSACGCQHGHQLMELMNECVCGTICDGYASLLREISAENPFYTTWLSLELLLVKLKGGWLLRAMWHLLEHDHDASATFQAAQDVFSQKNMPGGSLPLAWYDGLECKLLPPKHWNLFFFLLSLFLPYSCIPCCLWPD